MSTRPPFRYGIKQVLDLALIATLLITALSAVLLLYLRHRERTAA